MSIACHKMTQSKTLIRMLNRSGQGISYDEVQGIDTAWADMQINANHVVIPSNISPGIFTHAAADNWNRAMDALTWEHFDIVNMVLYQAKRSDLEGQFDCGAITHNKERKRSLTTRNTVTNQILNCPNLTGKAPGPIHLKNCLDSGWFSEFSEEHAEIQSVDKVWVFLRMCPTKLFQITFQRTSPQFVPGWSAFHAILSTYPAIPTNIGYCQAIPSPPPDFNTVYTVLKRAQSMFRRLGQTVVILTWDEALYSKAQIVKWRNPDEFADLFNRLGGFHRSTNFMGDIGTIMENSGLEDLFVESGIHGSAMVAKIFGGKAYNRGIRAHKLAFEALSRLKWKAFGNWLNEHNKVNEEEYTPIKEATDKLIRLFQSKDLDKQLVISRLNDLHDILSPLISLFFSEIEGLRSKTFQFWDRYLCMVSLLLDYVAAERDSRVDLHIESFAEMLVYDFVCNHQNYARWGTVYVAEMHIFQEEHPDIYEKFKERKHTIHRSSDPDKCFSGVWSDMGIEQSINKDCGTIGGLTSIKTNKAAMDRWFLTAHLKANVSSAFFSMLGPNKETHPTSHKENTMRWTENDEELVKSMSNLTEERMFSPFLVEADWTAEDPKPLCNIATGLVASDEVVAWASSIETNGKKQLEEFVTKRLNTQEEEFFEPITKNKIYSFATEKKKAKVKKDGKIVSIDLDK